MKTIIYTSDLDNLDASFCIGFVLTVPYEVVKVVAYKFPLVSFLQTAKTLH